MPLLTVWSSSNRRTSAMERDQGATRTRSLSPNLPPGCLKTQGERKRNSADTIQQQRAGHVSFGHEEVGGTSPISGVAASNLRTSSSTGSFIEGRSANPDLKIVISVRGPSGTLPGPEKQRSLAEAAAASLGVHPRGVQVHCYETTGVGGNKMAARSPPAHSASSPARDSPFSPLVNWLGTGRPASISTAARPLFPPPPTDGDESSSVAAAPAPDMMVVL